jgi:hypothetical protein
MSILKVPIQINGGDSVPSKLLERELFIDSSGYLHCGDGNGHFLINAGSSQMVGSVDTPIFINSNSKFSNARFGDINIRQTDNKWTIDGSNKSVLSKMTVDSCRLHTVLSLILDSGMYGTISDEDLPKKIGDPGQVFFRI